MDLPMFARRPSARIVSAMSLVGVALVAAAPVAAAEGGGATPIGQLALSARLAEWGRADRNPLALIVAAEIRRRSSVKTVERTPEQSGEASAAAVPAVEATADGLLAEAEALAPKDPTIRALADDVRGTATKGLVAGVGVSRSTLKGAGTDWYRKLRFEGSRYAEAYVELSGRGTVHVSVYDEAGNLVCRDPNPSSVAYCGWMPSKTATFDVKVENQSTLAVPYRMFTN